VDHTDFMLILGGNPAVSNGSLMSAPGIGKRLSAIRERGGQVVLIDPRRTETAALCDRHHFIRPGTDVLLMLALLHTVYAERLLKPGRLAEFTDGIERLGELAAEFSPEVAAGPTGISADDIRALARAFAAARSAVCYGRMGVSTQEFGAVTQWLVNALNLVTGNLDRPGGVLFTRPAFDLVEMAARLGQKGHFDKGRSRVRKLPEYGGEYPVAVLAEEILTPGPGQLKALVTLAGNPVLSTPNGGGLDRALASLPFMVSIDQYINETTRHAHIILPPTSALEHDHYDAVFHVLSVRNTAKYSPPVFTPADDTRHDWEILRELTVRLEARDKPLLTQVKRTLWNRVTPQRLLAIGLRTGPYGGIGDKALSLRKLQEAPHGVDLGPLTSCLPGRLYHASKRIPLVPELFVRDLDRVRKRLLGEAGAASAASLPSGFDLRLIGRRHLRSNNSWMHNNHRLVKGPARCTLLMHPQDAAQRGLAAAQQVQVYSRTGSIALPLEITDEMMPGVVSVPHGWGHDRPGVALATARQHAGASVNDLTDEQFVDELCGTAILNGLPVRVEAAAGAG
jgi:anaerobic selenocysteine-containing dehydrogenase